MVLRIGIIGTWSIADGCHAPAISALKKTILVWVLSRDKKKGRRFLNKHNANSGVVYTSLNKFVSDINIDLVIICSPDNLHWIQAYECLKARKHVLIEKPMWTNIKESENLIKLAKSNNLIILTGFHLRYHNGHKILYEKIINNNEIGTLRHIRILWAFPQKDDSNWRAKKELGKWWSLAAVGSHCIDLARWFSNNTLDWESFYSIINKDKWKGPHDETASIIAKTSSGIIIEITSSVQFWPYTRLELFWDEWYAICEWTLWREGWWKITINGKNIIFESNNPFVIQLKEVIKIIENKDSIETYSNIGLRNVKDLFLTINWN